jgi:Tfp pilus assembly PilM family ATPase
MSRLLALEWDNREVRVAIGAARGGELKVEDAFTIELAPRGEGADTPRAAGERIAAALAEKGVGKSVGLVAVGRGGIELKQLSLPPAPDDELPDLVRFQAMREFHSLGDEWPLDFIPLSTAPGASRRVLAAAISPELVGQVRQTCQLAKVSTERLVPRSCAAASLLARAHWTAGVKVKLLVDLLTEDADLTVLVDSDVVFLRTVRLSGDVLTSPGGHASLLGEIRRTVAAARNQLGGLTVEAIYLCGQGAAYTTLAAQIESGTSIPTHLFDPFAGLKLSSSLKRALPANTGCFAPVLGMLVDEAQQKRHAIDFLHPRKRPPPPDRRRGLLWAAVAATVVFAAGYLWLQGALGDLDEEIDLLALKAKNLDKGVAKAKELELAEREVAAWAAGDVNWLDELDELAADLPSGREVLLSRLTMGGMGGAGQIDMEGVLARAATASVLESRLRDESHQVLPRTIQQDGSKPGYGWKFTSSVVARPESPDTYRTHAKAAEDRLKEEKERRSMGMGGMGMGGMGWSPGADGMEGYGQPQATGKSSKEPAESDSPREADHGD